MVGLRLQNSKTVLQGLHQSGSAKALLPRVHLADPEVVFLNTAGGLTGGDRLEYGLSLGPGCRATATTQTAERAYASAGGTAQVDVTLTVGAGGFLDWLPQETILFNHAAMERRITVDLDAGAGCLFLESVILGRRAMGEDVRQLAFRDHRLIRRQGRPALADPLTLTDAVLARAGGPAVLGGARAFATLALVQQGAEDAAPRVRTALGMAGVEAAVSGFDGKCILRLLAADGWPLRQQLLRVLAALRDRPLPRVWQI